jgi:surfeit locus 1 family protein
MKRVIGFGILCTGTAVCVSAGFWQLRQKLWKENLISTRTEMLSRAAVKVQENPFPWTESTEDWSYKPVEVTGKFDYSKEMLILKKYGERAGYRVITPLTLQDGRTLIVNRGWMPKDNKPHIARPTDTTAVTGVLRPSEAQEAFLPQNNSILNEWSYIDLPQMALYANAVNYEEASKHYLQAIDFQRSREAYDGADLPEVPLRPVKDELFAWTVMPNTHLTYASFW